MNNKLKHIFNLFWPLIGYKLPSTYFIYRYFGFFIQRKLKKQILKKNSISSFKYNIQNKFQYGNNLLDLKNEEKTEIIRTANFTCSNIYNILGSGNVVLKPINWHADFKTNFQWEPGLFYKKYIQVDLDNDADVKIPRELSRSHHLLQVSLAYNFTGEEKYAKFCIYQIIDWIDNNRLMRSINWGSSMDVAIRSINWIWCINLLSKSHYLNNLNLVIQSLYEHGWFLFRNLEGNLFKNCNNHYLSNLVGLIYLGELFSYNKEGAKWLEYGKREIFREIRLQILPSGMSYERSTHYNRLVIEIVFWAILCLKNNGENIPQDILYRLEKMFDFIMKTIRPDKICPIIGDQDNGRLLPFGTEKLNDFSYLLSVGASLFNRADFKYYSNGYNIYCALLGKQYTFRKFSQIPNLSQSSLISEGFSDAGFFVLRNKRIFLLLNVENHGLYIDNNPENVHTHSDLFSFELFIEKTPLIIDVGSFVYTSNSIERTKFRETSMHNTVTVDGFSQHTFNANNIFKMSYDTKSVLKDWKTNDLIDIIQIEHNGYTRLSNPVIHERTIKFDKINNEITIIDKLTGVGKHLFEIFFYFSDLLEISMIHSKKVEVNSNHLKTLISFESDSLFNISKEDCSISYSYGTKIKSKKIVVKSHELCPFCLSTKIKPL